MPRHERRGRTSRRSAPTTGAAALETRHRDPATADWRLGRPADAEMMVRWTRAGEGRTTVAAERQFEITIDAVFRHVAAVRVLSSPYVDLLHSDRWFIVNVLWEVRQGETEP